MDEANQNTKSLEDIDIELEINGKASPGRGNIQNEKIYNPDEEIFPDDLENGNDAIIKSVILKDQDLTDTETYSDNVNMPFEKNSSHLTETYNKDEKKAPENEDSKLNPNSETEFKAPDPDELIKKNHQESTQKKKNNKNQPL